MDVVPFVLELSRLGVGSQAEPVFILPPRAYSSGQCVQEAPTHAQDRPYRAQFGSRDCQGGGPSSHVPVVAVSAPGVCLSSRGFGIDHDALKYMVIDVIHENDVLSKLNRLTGAIFTLGCGATNPFICHQPGQTICELLCHCGGSKAFSQCRFFTPTK